MAGAHLSREFFDLIKSIGEAKTKQEEDRIVVAEVAESKKKMGDRTLTGKKLKEYLLRLVYVEMLGHDASFGYMKAVELSASTNLLEKRVAYLCAGLCFAPEHEFRMMLVNRLQRDLQSANVLEVSIALSASAKILTSDMIPAVLPIVTNLLKHDQEIVRKKTVMLLHRFLQLAPESVTHMADKFRRALCDKDPSVMGASLHLFHEMVRLDPVPYKDLVPSFVSILKQVVEHRLPRDFDYHRVPAPWLQMKMLRILAAQGRADQASSEQMYEVLLDVIRRGDTGTNVGYAILYECVKTVTTIYPNSALLDAAAGSIARFITSDSHNLKYLGVTGLAAIVKDHPKYAGEHQLAVIDCLEDPDDTLKRKTLDLLYRMINPVNVEVIVTKLLDHLSSATDTFLRTDLVTRITSAAERFAPSNVWYVSTIASAFELGGDLVKPEVAANLIRLIAEGSGESPEADEELRRAAVETLMGLVDKPHLPNVLLQTLFWTVGEYGHLAHATHTLPAICEVIVGLAGRTGLDLPTRGHALAALTKLVAQLALVGAPPPPNLTSLTAKLSSSRFADLSQRVSELNSLLLRPQLMRAVLPVDASTEDIEVNLGFLDGFVAQATSSGARLYSKPVSEVEGGGGGDEGGSALKFDAYERNEGNFSVPEDTGVGGAGGGAGGGGAGQGAGGLNLVGAQGLGAKSSGMWGKEGYKSATGAVLAEGKVEAPKVGVSGPWGANGGSGASASASSASSAAAGAAAGPSGPTASAASLREFVSPAAAAPPAPKELTEKEKMAAALFGGLGGGSSKTTTGATKVGASAAAGGGAAKAFGATTTTTTTSAAVAPAAAAAAAAAPVPVKAAAPPPSVDLLDLFSSPAPTPAATSGPPSRDPFGGMGDMFSSAPPPQQQQQPLAAPSMSPSPALLAALPVLAGRSGEVCTPSQGVAHLLGGPGGVTLSTVKIAAAEGLHILLYASNASNAPIPSTQVAFQPPPFLTASYVGANGAPLAAGVGGAIPLGPLAPGAFTSLVITLTLCAIPGAGALSVQVSPPPAMGAPGAALEIAVRDVLRPAPIDTPSFGAVWTQPAMGGEATHVIPGCPNSAPDAVLARVPSMRFNPVQAIAATQEAISAARVMAMPNVYALLHTRAVPGGLELRVRTPDKGFSGAVLEGLVNALK